MAKENTYIASKQCLICHLPKNAGFCTKEKLAVYGIFQNKELFIWLMMLLVISLQKNCKEVYFML